MTYDEKRNLTAADVTLDGEPARICGAKLRFAVVRSDSGRQVEYAWPTVARIVAASGDFRTY